MLLPLSVFKSASIALLAVVSLGGPRRLALPIDDLPWCLA
jgi:hypothetical protein